MTPLLKNLFGNDSKDQELGAELRALLQEMRQERTRYEALLESSRASADRLQQLGEPIAKAAGDVDAMSARLGELEQRFAAMAKLAWQLQELDERAAGLAQGQQRAETQVATAVEDAERILSAFEEVGRRVDLAAALKDRLEAFLEVEKPFEIVRGDADALRGQVEGTGDQLARLREQQGRLLDAHKLAMAKMEALDRRREELSRDLQDKERRVAAVAQSVRGMDGVQHTITDLKRDLGTLKALGDFVTQKSAALEAQREAVEVALARADQLDRAVRQIDAGVRQQQENEMTLGALQEQVAALQSLHETVLERTREISQLQHEADERAVATRHDLAAVQDELKQAVERFDFESRGLESVSQRVTDMRGALSDFEQRFKGLSESSHTVAELDSQTQALAAHLQSLSGEVEQIDEEAGKLQALRRDLDEMSRTARDAGAQVARIEEARPAVEAALRDFEHLGGAHALVKDAFEQTQLAHGEIVRVRESQAETRTWLAEVEQAVQGLRDQAGDVQRMAPTIEFAQKQTQRISESMAAIESRREFVEDLHRRMTELGTLGGNLDERGRQLLARMEAAEQRFLGLATQAEEAERMSRAITAVSSSLHEAGQKTSDIGRTVTAIEARCESVEELAERTRTLRQELEQRQHALDEAAKDLQRASGLRQEAAVSAQQLDESARRLAAALAATDQRAARVDALSTQLEHRAAGLQPVEKRLDQFEERLAKWDLTEQEIARSLEQVSARQGVIEALRADLDRMFVTAEQTAADVRGITAARREIEESRGLLEDVSGRLREIRDTTSAIDERQRQMTKAEERLARAEALLVHVQSSVEALHGQKVVVDQAVEKAGSLRGLLKQAEAMLEGLKEERELMTRVRAAVAVVRQGDDADGDEEMAKAA